MPIRSKELKTASRYNKCNISVNRHTGKKNPMGKGGGGYTPKGYNPRSMESTA